MADVRLRDLNPAEFDFAVNIAGPLGVGTTSPEGDVEIKSDGSASTGAHLRLRHGNNNSTDVISTINFSNNVGSVAKIESGTTSGNTNGYISFYTDSAGTSAERMRILSDGKVGIGTNSPSQKLEVLSNANGGVIPIVIANRDTSAGTNQNVSLGFGLSRNSGAFKDRAGKIQVGRELDWTVDDANIDSFMAFYTYQNNAESEKMRIDSSGRVGIGITSPQNELHVSGTSTMLQLQSSTTTAKIQFNNSGGNACFIGSNNNKLIFQTNSTNRVTITNGGDVGIGTTNPTDALTVGDGTSSIGITINKSVSGTGTLEFENAGTDKCYVRCNASEALIFGTADTDRVSILENGKVGIGTNNPEETLHVNGNLKVTGSIDVGSSGFNVSSGFILAFGAGTAPSGWLECDGAAVSRSTYSALFAIIGTTYGAGDGSTTFNVPDLQGRVIVGQGGSTVNRTPTDLENIGDTFGSQTHTLTVDELPSHTHQYDYIRSRRGSPHIHMNHAGDSKLDRINTTATGGDQAHNNIQPSIVINYLIKT